MWMPCLVPTWRVNGEVSVRVGHELVDEYLRFLAGRARPNTVLAAGYDLKVFFAWSRKEPTAIRTKDVINFVAAQRSPRRSPNVVRRVDGEGGLSARTVARRLSSLSGFYSYLLACGDVGVTTNPVPRGLATRSARRNNGRAAPLVRRPRLLLRILEPAEVNALVGALRTARDRAMVEAMVLGGLHVARCWRCASRTCGSASAGCSSPRARAATNGSSPCRRASSPASPSTSITSGRRMRPPTVSSSCSRGPTAESL